jgi:glyoxylase-like metal-dependent hydrolase (beta-lactamase superfamily II)
MDHLGLLEVLARRSGAEIAALHLLAPYIENFSRSANADDEFAQQIMRRHGVPRELLEALGSVGAAFRAFGSSGRVTLQLRDGDQLALRDRRLRIFHRPGHSPSDTILWDEEAGILIAGDHLLARISSNPLVSRPLTGGPDAPRPHALITYLKSMRATRELPARLVLPGHGEPIIDHRALIDERLRMHARRARKVLRLLDHGALTAYEIAVEMWGNVAVTQAYLTLSEVLGHLDLLVADEEVRELESGGVARFERVSSRIR